ncbi:hypothetical protein B8T99_12025 [Vibrio cholerae]|uniref:DUF4250 domain-containing protein n=7 Tax=Gammaproteobacteria TaxID=1236 RepID=Q9KRD5_VIBCH|nr:hypothetical protein VC_1707 [Vibrio cholerae O1 biovar El Tor str. N16961]ABQ20202.1 hypothetical protein VC0395_A1310 [Vibrio cholerae O395]ACP05956.1 conserved hypothetical protein [Vibrio cholerae M66-2]ACQ60836.1 hypothetical protein VCD_002672 [Vibrio cholerae MJ-1236]EAZ74890.1 hypothetical protein A5C_1742 [Vibrio cholerae NCTC 8457]EAZ77864.1 hypothetical protein A5E_2009 [Vibrio cholerae B33]EEN98525.1 hypothetical protein VCG_002358 [Vibrio cholerae 12129(1)]EEO02396.1 hypothet
MMDLSNVRNFDSVILLGIVNEKLRLECDSLDELISTYEMDIEHLVGKLDVLGYQYDPLTNQFKAYAR